MVVNVNRIQQTERTNKKGCKDIFKQPTTSRPCIILFYVVYNKEGDSIIYFWGDEIEIEKDLNENESMKKDFLERTDLLAHRQSLVVS